MKVRRKILFTLSVLLSFLLIYISIRVVLSINTIKVNQVFYGQNLDKFLILGYTQLSCVVAVLFDIWTVFLTYMGKNILLNVNNRKSGMFHKESQTNGLKTVILRGEVCFFILRSFFIEMLTCEEHMIRLDDLGKNHINSNILTV